MATKKYYYKLPTSDEYSSGTWSPTTNRYLKVDDPVGNADDTTTELSATTNNAETRFGFDHTFPSDATILYIKVHIKVKIGAGALGMTARLYVGGTGYSSGSRALTTAYANYAFVWEENPKSSAAWTVEDLMNQTDDGLISFGVVATTAVTSQYDFTQIYLEVGLETDEVPTEALFQEGEEDILKTYFNQKTPPTSFELSLWYHEGVNTEGYADLEDELGGSAEVIENCNDAWDELVDGDVTSTTDGADSKLGVRSIKLVVAGAAGAGDILATEDIVSADLSSYSYINVWIKCSVDTAEGDLQLLLDDTANCASPIKSLDIPALSAGVWQKVVLLLGDASGLTAVISVGLKYVTDLGACTIHVDDVRAVTNGYHRQYVGAGSIEITISLVDGHYQATTREVDLVAAVDWSPYNLLVLSVGTKAIAFGQLTTPVLIDAGDQLRMIMKVRLT